MPSVEATDSDYFQEEPEEDFTWMRKLYVTCYKKKIPGHHLYELLSKFGTIKDVEFVRKHHNHHFLFEGGVYVTYVKPEATCRLLTNIFYEIRGSILKVTPVYNWIPFKSVPGSVCNFGTNALVRSPIKLPYSTVYLKHFFEDLKPGLQIHCTRINEQFRNFFVEFFCRDEYQNFRVDHMKEMELCDIRRLLRYAGKYMLNITGQLPSANREYIVERMAKYCPNLQYINLTDSEVAEECFCNFLNRLPDLRQLHITKTSFSDKLILSLKGLRKLESLSLSNDHSLNGKYLKNLNQLRHLSLYDCRIINQRYLVEACNSMKNLNSLDIRCIDGLNPEFYKTISKHCRRIEVLKMSCPPFHCNRVALMPKLKHLELLHRCKKESLSIIQALAHFKANQLEVLIISSGKYLTAEHITQISMLKKLKKLSITCNGNAGFVELGELRQLEELTISACANVFNDVLLYLLKMCPALSTIYAELCKRVTCDFIKPAVKMVNNDKRKFTFYANGTSIKKEDILKCAAATSAVRIRLRRTGHNLDVEKIKD